MEIIKIITHTLLSTLMLLISVYVFPQKSTNLDKVIYIAEYNLTFQPDSNNAATVREETMLLLIGESMSKFQSYNSYLRTQALENQGVHVLESMRDHRTVFHFEIYKNYPENQITTTDQFFANDHFKYLEPLGSFVWVLSDSLFVWKNYNVQKAYSSFGGRQWEAWFTSEIPISDGPYKFHGLPGLIIKLKDTKSHYVFNLNKIYTPESAMIIEFFSRPYVETDKQGYFTAYNYFINNIVSVFEEDSRQPLNDEAKFRLEMNARRRNNPIELTID